MKNCQAIICLISATIIQLAIAAESTAGCDQLAFVDGSSLKGDQMYALRQDIGHLQFVHYANSTDYSTDFTINHELEMKGVEWMVACHTPEVYDDDEWEYGQQVCSEIEPGTSFNSVCSENTTEVALFMFSQTLFDGAFDIMSALPDDVEAPNVTGNFASFYMTLPCTPSPEGFCPTSEPFINPRIYKVTDNPEGGTRSGTSTEVCSASSNGDPHITTFDKLKYDCQAEGELVLLKSMDGYPSDFEIQGRFKKVKGNKNREGTGMPSVTTGFVIHDGTLPTVQFSISEDPDAPITFGGCPVQMYVNGEEVDMLNFNDTDYLSLTLDEADDLTVKRPESDIILAYETTEVEAHAKVRKSIHGGVCLFNVQIQMPCDYRGVEPLAGLFGSNPDKIKTNDWMTNTGELVPTPKTKSEAKFKYAYDYCTREWCLRHSKDSLFTYENGTTFDDYMNCDFGLSEELQEKIYNPTPEMLTACNNDKEDYACLIEALVLGEEGAKDFVETEKKNKGGGRSSSQSTCLGELMPILNPTNVTEQLKALYGYNVSATYKVNGVEKDGKVVIRNGGIGVEGEAGDVVEEPTLEFAFDQPIKFKNIKIGQVSKKPLIRLTKVNGSLRPKKGPKKGKKNGKATGMRQNNIVKASITMPDPSEVLCIKFDMPVFVPTDGEVAKKDDEGVVVAPIEHSITTPCFKTTKVDFKIKEEVEAWTGGIRRKLGGFHKFLGFDGEKEISTTMVLNNATTKSVFRFDFYAKKGAMEDHQLLMSVGGSDFFDVDVFERTDMVNRFFNDPNVTGLETPRLKEQVKYKLIPVWKNKKRGKLHPKKFRVRAVIPENWFDEDHNVEIALKIKGEVTDDINVYGIDKLRITPKCPKETVVDNVALQEDTNAPEEFENKLTCAELGYGYGLLMQQCGVAGTGISFLDSRLTKTDGSCVTGEPDLASFGTFDLSCDQLKTATVTTTSSVGVKIQAGENGLFDTVVGTETLGVAGKDIENIEFCIPCPKVGGSTRSGGQTGPVPAPVPLPVAAPVAAPIPSPVSPPVAAPVSAPVSAPVPAPIPTPVAAPVPAPVPQNEGHNLVGGLGSSSGDPHFKTWNGEKFDYHGECDLVLVDHPAFNNGQGLRVHIRTTRVGYYSYIERIAVQIGDDVLEFANDVENFTINGEIPEKQRKRHKTLLGGFPVRRDKKALSIRLHDVSRKLHDGHNVAKIDLKKRKLGFAAVLVDGGGTDIFLGSRGLLGHWPTGQKMARDGVTLMNEDRNAYGLEWQVRDDEPMLFQDARFPQFPATCIPPKKMLTNRLGLSRAKAEAEVLCAHWGADKDDCIFDVIATRNPMAASVE